MWRISVTTIIYVLVISVCDAQTRNISIRNPIDVARTDELVVLKRTDIEKEFGPLGNGMFVYVTDKQKKRVAIQFDDLDGDKRWDEVAFLYSFNANEKADFSITISANDRADVLKRAHVRLRKKNTDDTFGPVIISETMPYRNPPTDFSKIHLPLYLTEGPAWENDKVAFRQYFDTRNTRDIYGKTTDKMVMDTVGINYKNSYHELSGWGMDIFHVERSLGAGSVAIKTKDTNGRDTLIRLGGKDIQKETYHVISDGPVRATFQISYDWVINNMPVQVSEITSIWGGQYFYETKLILKGVPENSELITGIGDFFDNTTANFETEKSVVFLSHGRQSENKDFLGLAIVCGKQHFISAGKIAGSDGEVKNTYFVAQHIKDNTTLSYRFFSCWEKTDSRFVSMEYFKKYMENEARKVSNPPVVKW